MFKVQAQAKKNHIEKENININNMEIFISIYN